MQHLRTLAFPLDVIALILLICCISLMMYFDFRKVEEKIREKLRERGDYQAYYYRPVLGKYHRASRESAEEQERIRGD